MGYRTNKGLLGDTVIRNNRTLIAVVLATCLLAVSCGDASSNGGDDGLPEGAHDIFSKAEIELYEEQGFVVHRGSDPPIIEGTYEMADSVVVWDEDGRYTEGHNRLVTYEFTFFDQSGDELFLSFASSGDRAYGLWGQVAGRGECFTVFTEFVQPDIVGCMRRRKWMLSGCKADGGIDDFQMAGNSHYTGESTDDRMMECMEEESPRTITMEQDGIIDQISE